MDWTQFIIFCVSVFGVFIWNRSEARADWRHMDTKLESTRELVRAIHDEVKDFHGRLEKLDAEFKANLLRERNK